MLTKARAVCLAEVGGELVWTTGDGAALKKYVAAEIPQLSQSHDLCISGAV